MRELAHRVEEEPDPHQAVWAEVARQLEALDEQRVAEWDEGDPYDDGGPGDDSGPLFDDGDD